MIGFGGVARESHQAHLATYRGDDKAANALLDGGVDLDNRLSGTKL